MSTFEQLISPQRIAIGMIASSKKRLLEKLGELMHADVPELDVNAAFSSLIERERLGSTGIGHGVALPHGRLRGLDRAVGALGILAEDMDFEAIDNQPVRLVFALLVPEEANEEHLRLLSLLATLFSKEDVRQHLLKADNPEDVYHYLASQDRG